MKHALLTALCVAAFTAAPAAAEPPNHFSVPPRVDAAAATKHGFEREVFDRCMASAKPRGPADDAGWHVYLACADRLHAAIRKTLAAVEAGAAERPAAKRPVWMRRERPRAAHL